MIAQIKIFYSYAHEDEQWRNELEKHLSNLEQPEPITGWHDRKIVGGKEWAPEIATKINEANIILLLISPDFMASQYCNEVEVPLAMERHKAGEASVIPIIIHPANWKKAPFARLQALPTDGKSISSWLNRDEAFLDVKEGIRKAIEEQRKKPSASRSKMTNNKSEVQRKVTKSSQVWNVPFRRNPFFTGRENILNSLHNMLARNNTAALTQPQAISGLGGIGKTQIAVEYAYRYRHDYRYIFWVKCETDETIVSDFVTIAGLLNLSEENAQDRIEAVRAVNRWLEMNTNWLLIFDNADDLQSVHDFLPSRGKGHILLTTRAYSMSGIAQRVEVEKMEPKQGALFLLRRAGIIGLDAPLSASSESDHLKAEEISKAMDGLPLALDQAGAFIEETACGLADYLDLYRKQSAELLKQRGGFASPHPEPVATTWSLSFKNVEQANPAAAELLRLCAFLHPDAISEEIIIKGAPELGPVLQPIVTDPIKLNKAIGELLKYSLVRRDRNSRTLSVHRLVQAVLKDDMDEDKQRRWAEHAVRAVKLAFPDVVEVSTWPICQKCLPHAQVCAELIQRWDMKFTEAAQLLNDVGYYLDDRALYAEAEPLYLQAIAIYERVSGSDHPYVATTLNNLALLYKAQDKYMEAEPLYQRALAIREKTLGPEHPDVAVSLNNMAGLYRTQSKYDEAEPLYQRALAIREKTLGPEHPDVAVSLNNMAGLYYVQGKYAEAESLYQRALTIHEKFLGSKHPNVVTSLNNMAGLCYAQSKYDEAERLYQRVLKIDEDILGPDHPDLATVLENYAFLLRVIDRETEAAELEIRAKAIQAKHA